jgi:hypothetical protein
MPRHDGKNPFMAAAGLTLKPEIPWAFKPPEGKVWKNSKAATPIHVQ